MAEHFVVFLSARRTARQVKEQPEPDTEQEKPAEPERAVRNGRQRESERFLRRAVALYTGRDCEEAVILREKRGKPYFADPSLPHFSLSHSGDFLACAMGPSPCGVDIQTHETAVRHMDRLAKRYFHPIEWEAVLQAQRDRENTAHKESQLLPDTSSLSRTELFFAIWTAKESYVKYTGEGIIGRFSSFSVLPSLAVDGTKLRAFPVAAGYSGFLCAGGAFTMEIVPLSIGEKLSFGEKTTALVKDCPAAGKN